MPKTCEIHSGIEARVGALEAHSKEHAKELKALRITLARWGGAICAIPIILKLLEWIVPAAHAAINQ